MHFSLAIASCAWLAGVAALRIPAVDHMVSSVLSGSLAPYTAYHGPTGTAAVALASATPRIQGGPNAVLNYSTLTAVSDPPYWLADIAHQGYAPYSPDPSSYKVFRNVKDYGAKGVEPSLRLSLSLFSCFAAQN
jgi:glucan 1,3-beta-glucosidase